MKKEYDAKKFQKRLPSSLFRDRAFFRVLPDHRFTDPTGTTKLIILMMTVLVEDLVQFPLNFAKF